MTDAIPYASRADVAQRDWQIKAADAAAATNNSGGGTGRLQRGGGCLWSVVHSQTQQLLVKFNIKNSNDLHANQHSRILQ